MNEAPKRVLAVFTEALPLPAAERSGYLDRACAGDGELRRQVEGLLRAFEKAGDFLGEPAASMPTGAGREIAAGEKPGDEIGPYKLLQQIGEGGCGVVFMAEQEAPVRRRVAVKVVKPGMDSKNVIARFEAERQALALMEHPNIAHVFDAGTTGSGRPYFVMELIRGIKITDYCDQNSLTTIQRLELFTEVCNAVQHAHQKGIIHRDIKPSNILVTTSAEGKPVPKVIDFGIAKATTGQRLTNNTVFTAFEMLIGTPAYMSPEQAALTSVDVDTRSDIYSLGVLLYELLTGTTPFDTQELLKAGLDEVRRVIQTEEPVHPSTRLRTMLASDLTTISGLRKTQPPNLIREVRGDLDWIVMKALEKDRTRRYQTSGSLAEDVKHYLANETVCARPPSMIYKLHKLVLRNKLLFAGLGVILVVLLAALGVTSWSLSKEKQAHLESDAAGKKAQMNERQALLEVSNTVQVTRFLKDMLQAVGPSVAAGRDTTMLREILDNTAERVGKELSNQPIVEAELRSEIGRVYGQLWLYDQAEAMDRLALAGYQKLYGNENLNVASSLSDLAYALEQQRKFAEAETDYRQALAIRRKLSGDENPDVAESLSHLATALWRERKLGEAETLCRKALAMQRKLLGGTNLDVAETLNTLAIVLAQQSEWSEAELRFREALEMRRKFHVDEHPQVAETLRNLGNTLYQEGKFAEAETMYRDTLAIERKLRTDEHPATLVALDALLATLAAQGKELGNAEPLLNEFLTPAFVAKPESAPFLFKRANLFARRGRWSEAEADAAKALEYEPTDHQTYHTLAPLLAVTHDLVNYQKLCQRIVTRFEGSTNADIADRMAKDCLILPSSGVDLRAVGELAETAVTVGSQENWAYMFRCCKALAEYRQGHFGSAVEWARLASTNQFPYSQAEAFAILSMGQYKLNQVDAARTNLSNCEKVVLTQLPGLGSDDLGRDWRDWIIVHALLTEAQQLLDAPPARLNSSQPTNK